MDFDPTILTCFALFAAGLVAGFVDSIAGGGGLIALPALLSLGIPPTLALGTNKFQGTFGSLFAALHYRAAGLVRFRQTIFGIATTAIGALCGTLLVQRIDNSILKTVVTGLLLLIFLHVLFAPQVGNQDRRARLSKNVFYLVFGFGLGFYDGFFGPGVGSFWAIALVSLLGLNLKSATAHTKTMNFTSNIVSLMAFVLSGQVLFKIGLSMAAGQFVGASLGARLVILKGTKFIRIFFLCVVVATLGKMIFSFL